MEPKEDRGKPPPSPWATALSAGTQLVVSVLLGVLFGRWLDARMGTGPWLALAGTMAGIGIGLYHLVREAGRLPPPGG